MSSGYPNGFVVLCSMRGRETTLTENGMECRFATKKEAKQAAAKMRLLMEGSKDKCSYKVIPA